MRKALPYIALILLAGLAACTNSVAPEETSLRMKFAFKFGHPDRDSLLPLYPNPFSHAAGDSTIVIQFTLKDSTRDGHLLIQNVIGDEVVTYSDSVLAPGTYTGSWNPTAADGTALRSGLYFVTLRSPNYIYSRLVNIQDNE
jgi:hypothetical protein